MSTENAPVPKVPPRRSIPAAIGISFAMAAVIGAMSFFLTMFISIIVLLIVGTHRGSAQAVDFSQSYRVFALPVGLAGIVVGFFWTLVHSLRSRRRSGLV